MRAVGGSWGMLVPPALNPQQIQGWAKSRGSLKHLGVRVWAINDPNRQKPCSPQERTAQEVVKSASQVFLPNQGEGKEGKFSPATCSSLTACPQFQGLP